MVKPEFKAEDILEMRNRGIR